ncbi:MAG: UDP-3-O-(3-hydroxymyristoyl)glucosamine N-acyltransferase [Pseudomonadota bacterium]
MPWPAARLADHLGLTLVRTTDDSSETTLNSAAPLGAAQTGQLSFLANPKYRKQLATTRASAVIVPEDAVQDCPCDALVSDNPYASWAQALDCLYPPTSVEAGIAASAVIDASADVDPSSSIGPQCVIAAGVRIGPRVRLGPGCVVERNARISADAHLVSQVYIGERVRLGERVIVHPGVVIGADGFGLAMQSGQWRKVAQIGSVVIGDDCEIGANSTIDRGALADTILGRDVRIDNQVQIAHNVEIGDHTAIAGCVGIAGSTRIGRYCMIAGAAGVSGHLEICDQVVITGMTPVMKSIDQPGHYGSAIPARPMQSWKRVLVRLGQLDQWMKPKR